MSRELRLEVIRDQRPLPKHLTKEEPATAHCTSPIQRVSTLETHCTGYVRPYSLSHKIISPRIRFPTPMNFKIQY